MLLLIELVVVTVLILALTALFVEEEEIKRMAVPRGAVKEYWDGEERRKTLRLKAELPVRYSIEKKLSLKLNGAIKDISKKGIRLIITEKLAHGTLLLLEFDIPGTKEAISADGKVVWTNGGFDKRYTAEKRMFESGVQFVTIKPGDDTRLASYIKQMSN